MNGDGWRIGVDIGGTFADCVGIAPDGTRRRIKILTDGRVRTLATPVGHSSSTGTAHPQYALTALPPWAAPALIGMTAVAADGSERVVLDAFHGLVSLQDRIRRAELIRPRKLIQPAST